jgi:hypothetical protein
MKGSLIRHCLEGKEMQKVITISEVIYDDQDECDYCVSSNFESDFDDEYLDRLVDAEECADAVNIHNGGDCKIVKPSS